MKRYVLNILIAIDQLGNALRGGNPDETISSDIAKSIIHFKDANWFERVIGWFLELIDPGHLERSIEWDEGRQWEKWFRTQEV